MGTVPSPRSARVLRRARRQIVRAILRRGLMLVGLLMLSGCGDSSQVALRIMPLGDSITEAEAGRASYRYWLWQALERENFEIDFVGSQHGVYEGEPLFPDFDQDHEGHWGWTTGRVRGRIEEYALAQPDVVLLLLGTNDGDRNLARTTANLAAIVESLRIANPRVAVLIAKVPPVAGYPGPGRRWPAIPRLNAAIEALALRLDRPESRVVLVDQWTDFDPFGDSYDGIHPNEAGERKLAERWLDALLALRR